MNRVLARLSLPALLIALAIPAAATGGGGDDKRCWPEVEGCPAKAYERKAAHAASRTARERFDQDFPPGQWTVVCYPKAKRAAIDCSVHTRDDIPYSCVGGMTMKKRDGRWRARKIEMSCSR